MHVNWVCVELVMLQDLAQIVTSVVGENPFPLIVNSKPPFVPALKIVFWKIKIIKLIKRFYNKKINKLHCELDNELICRVYEIWCSWLAKPNGITETMTE